VRAGRWQGRGARAVLTVCLLALAAIASGGANAAGGEADDEPRRAAERRGGLSLQLVGSYDQPMYVHGPKGAPGLLFVVERRGTIKVRRNGRDRGTFLDIRRLVSCCGGERGLFSIAFANWRTSRRFYVYCTDHQGDLRVAEFKRRKGNPLRALKRSRRNLLDIRHRAFSNHNGGQLQWGPDDKLYIATGDGGGAGDPSDNAQDKRSLLGKLLRINPLKRSRKRPYGTPGGNPYVGRKGRDEIYARGLRNPWRFSFDRRRILIADVGQQRWEEVNLKTLKGLRNANFGWDAFEGTARYEGPRPARHDRPIHTYGHSGGRCAITGGYVVRNPDLRPLYRRYIYGDLCTGEIRSLRPRTRGGVQDRSAGLPNRPALVSFGTDARRNVYVVAGDAVYRIVR
jgi:hypothetical protein